jgi:hypothetical protein
MYLCTHLTEVRILVASSEGVPVEFLLMRLSNDLILWKNDSDIVGY